MKELLKKILYEMLATVWGNVLYTAHYQHAAATETLHVHHHAPEEHLGLIWSDILQLREKEETQQLEGGAGARGVTSL